MSLRELEEAYLRLCKGVFGFDRMIRIGEANLQYKERYYLTYPTRAVIWIRLTISLIQLTLQGKIAFRIMLKILMLMPKFIIFNGGLASLGSLVTSIDYDNFARSEANRLQRSYR